MPNGPSALPDPWRLAQAWMRGPKANANVASASKKGTTSEKASLDDTRSNSDPPSPPDRRKGNDLEEPHAVERGDLLAETKRPEKIARKHGDGPGRVHGHGRHACVDESWESRERAAACDRVQHSGEEGCRGEDKVFSHAFLLHRSTRSGGRRAGIVETASAHRRKTGLIVERASDHPQRRLTRR